MSYPVFILVNSNFGFEIVTKYLEKSADYTDKLCALRYKRGFQTGMLLAFETMKFDI